MKKFHVTNITFTTLKADELLVVEDGSSYFEIKNGGVFAKKPLDIIVPESHYADGLIEELGNKMHLFGTVVVRTDETTLDMLNIPA